jgi:hypothetical protein
MKVTSLPIILYGCAERIQTEETQLLTMIFKCKLMEEQKKQTHSNLAMDEGESITHSLYTVRGPLRANWLDWWWRENISKLIPGNQVS